VILDAQTLQYLKALVTRAILSHPDNIFSAFQAIKKLKEMHKTTQTQTLVDLHQKWLDSKFSTGFNRVIYASDIKQVRHEICTSGNHIHR